MIDISIIIPIFNGEKTIGYCLESILSQVKYLSYEIIIIDDGSTDKTEYIIKSYQQKYPRIIYIWQKNQKQSVARNTGLDIAKGKYVFFFDGDDLVADNMICSMYETINSDNSTDLVVCGIKKIFCDKYNVVAEKNELNSFLKESSSIIPDYLVYSKEMDVGLWNKVFKRSVIEKNKIRFSNGNFFEDSLFVLNYILASNKKIIFLNQPLYSLFKRSGSTTCQFNSNIINYALSYINKTIGLCSEFNIKLSQTVINSFVLRTYLHIIHHNIKNNIAFNKLDRQKIKKEFGIKGSMLLKNKLTFHFKIALICYVLFPKLYIKLYQKIMPK